MNVDQFEEFSEYLLNAFPAVNEFLSTAGDSAVLLNAWLEVLEPYDPDEVRAAVSSILAGEDSLPYDKSLIAARIKAICDRKRTPPPHEQRHDQPAGAVEWNMGEIYLKLKECRRNGGDVHALARELMPIPDTEQPRYRCLICHDRGVVMCWHPLSMRLAKLGRLEPGKGCYQNAVRCKCRAGDKYAGMSLGGWNSHTKEFASDIPTVYDERMWLICDRMDQDEVDQLVAFVANYKPANYNPSFDSFNEREAY